MTRLIETVALASALLVTLCAPLTLQARGITAENRSELANVPPSWTGARICFQEGGGVGGPRVVIGVERRSVAVQHFALRPEKPGAPFPTYLLDKAGDTRDRQLNVSLASGVGYTDEHLEVFVMPGGVRLTCEGLPTVGPDAN